MKIGVSTYSFSREIQQGRLTLLEVPAKVKEMGFDGIEFAAMILPDGETPVSFAPRLRDACDRLGLPVVNYTIGADFINGSGGDWRAEVERLQTEVQVAKILGATGMRHDATGGFPSAHVGPRDFTAALPTLIEGCRAITAYAAEQGIRTMVENHGFFSQDSERIERLVNGVNHPNFGLLVDVGNFLCVDEDPGQALGRLLPYAFHIHFKDFHRKPGSGAHPGNGWFQSRGGNFLRGAIIGHGDAPVVQCLRLIKRQGYTGMLSIEFEGMEDPPTGIAIGLENLRRYVGEVNG